MPQLFPPEIIENTVECYHAKISTRSKVFNDMENNAKEKI